MVSDGRAGRFCAPCCSDFFVFFALTTVIVTALSIFSIYFEADHSYALPQNAVPAHESSGDMADMAPSIYGPSPEDSLSSSAGVLSHRGKCSFILPLAPFCFVLLKCTN